MGDAPGPLQPEAREVQRHRQGHEHRRRRASISARAAAPCCSSGLSVVALTSPSRCVSPSSTPATPSRRAACDHHQCPVGAREPDDADRQRPAWGYDQPQQRHAPRVQRDFPATWTPPARWRRAAASTSARAASASSSNSMARSPTPARSASPASGARSPCGRVGSGARGDRGQVEAGFAFDSVMPEKHRELVELMFSDDRSWMKSTYPRDDPFRSFAYLMTTLWRVMQARRPSRRLAPRLAGPWPCTANGQTGTCVSLSARGGLLDLPAPSPQRRRWRSRSSWPGSVRSAAPTARARSPPRELTSGPGLGGTRYGGLEALLSFIESSPGAARA